MILLPVRRALLWSAIRSWMNSWEICQVEMDSCQINGLKKAYLSIINQLYVCFIICIKVSYVVVHIVHTLNSIWYNHCLPSSYQNSEWTSYILGSHTKFSLFTQHTPTTIMLSMSPHFVPHKYPNWLLACTDPSSEVSGCWWGWGQGWGQGKGKVKQGKKVS